MNNRVTRLCSIALFGVASTLSIGPAHAQTTIPFSISGSGLSASGTLTGDYVTLSGFAGTVFTVTGASGSYSDSMDGISGTITGILPSKTYTSIPSNSNHDGVLSVGVPIPPASSYDNVVYPYGDSPVVCDPVFYPFHGGKLDIYGLMLTLDLQGGGNGLVNVWSNGNLNDPSNPLGLDYGVSDGTFSNSLYTVSNYLGNTNNYPTNPNTGALYTPSGILFTTVPEPSALILLGSGIAALPLLRLRRKKRA